MFIDLGELRTTLVRVAIIRNPESYLYLSKIINVCNVFTEKITYTYIRLVNVLQYDNFGRYYDILG